MERLRAHAHQLRVNGHALWIAARDRRTPWLGRMLAWILAAYALSPIDIVPDFVPVLGFADDLVILGLGIWLFRCFIPDQLFDEYRRQAEAAGSRPVSWAGAFMILGFWAAILALAALYVWSWRFY